ncbi:Mannosyl-oligosaccharide alpha-1,2-mannosidase [Pseudocercospora fuligena]|uniref:alpha-1,2-Mannosidase n=1 Tax=Pseudocercospora fuligena TaxID=685502 RepID=A0A8H6R798_9PEZI|nr:Mannosyl-oligosaccharide alpha-1,2-mannosidase [Pseudocercospora fuligena]
MSTRRAEIKAAFQHAWNGYSQQCFGHDAIHPVSNTCEDDFGGWGATALDALSTAMILGERDIVLQILRHIARLDFSIVQGGSKIQVFEVTIRHLGGMISGWDLLNGPYRSLAVDLDLRLALYDKMVELGGILSCAFSTPSGIPRDWLDPATCQTDSGTMNTVAGAGTMILEFSRLSDITGSRTYALLAQKAEDYLLNPIGGQPFPGLLGSHVSVEDGRVIDENGSWGAFSDSFYEYLLKAYIYNSKNNQRYLERWLLAADSTIRYIASHPYGQSKLTLLPSWSGNTTDNRMETLSWFAGGNLILGGMITNNQTLIDFGTSIADTAAAVYNMTRTGLGPEFVTWNTDCPDGDCKPIQISDGRYRMRPEVFETWYYAYRATRDPKYIEWSWMAFEAIDKTCRTQYGFSAINNVDEAGGGAKLDKQESFLFAEVFKYLYLIHAEDDTVPMHVQDSRTGKKNLWVLNTEAHPILVAGPPV